MKKTISLLILTILCVSLSTKLYAQTTDFGVKGGLSIPSLTGDVNDNVKSRVAFHAGLFAEVSFSDMFSIQPELLYSSQGYKFVDDKGINDYLNVPIMGKFYPIEGFHIEMGPQFGFLLSAKEKGKSRTQDVKEGYKTFDFGLNFGTGYKLTDYNLLFGVRYNLGLTNVLKDNSSKIKNGVFQISVGYLF